LAKNWLPDKNTGQAFWFCEALACVSGKTKCAPESIRDAAGYNCFKKSAEGEK